MSNNKTETKEKEQLTGGKKALKVLKVILNVIINTMIVLILVVSILVAVMALTSKANDGMSSIFGYSVQTIQSDSMKGGSPDGYEGGDFEKGDLIIGKMLDRDKEYTFEKGDIVTFKSKDAEGNDFFEVHRIIDYAETDGYRTYQTQGDNRVMSEVPDQLDKADYIPGYSFTSVFYDAEYKGTIMKGWGNVFDAIKEPQTFFFVVLIPMIIFFVYAIIRVVLNAIEYRKSKEDDAKKEAEQEKKEAVEAAVAAALAEKDKPAEEAPADMTPEQMEQFKQFLAFQEAQKAQQSPAEPAAEETPVDTTEE